MNKLQIIKGVECFVDDNGVAQLKLENVARGLGFTQNKNGVDYVRKDRIQGYLNDFGFSPQVGKEDFIPEPIFYLLCMKAENDTAKAFQHTVAYDVLPEIRKFGMYAKDEILDNPDLLIEVATQLKNERSKRKQLESKVEQDAPKVLFADAVSTAKTSILIGELAKIIKQNGVDMGEKRMFDWMRKNGYLIKRQGTDYNAPTQKSMELGLFEVKETAITHSDGHVTVNKTTKVNGRGQQYFINKFLEAKTA